MFSIDGWIKCNKQFLVITVCNCNYNNGLSVGSFMSTP